MHASPAQQAEQLKAKGNEYFKKDKLGAAIDAYTEAIALCPTVPTYWTNRAICYRRRSDWERVHADCKKALELDKSLLKAHKLMGTALLQLKHYPDAIRSLKKVLDLGAVKGLPPDNSMMLEAEVELGQAQYEEWQLGAQERRERQKRLKTHLQRLLKEDLKRRMEASSADGEGAVDEPPPSRWRRAEQDLSARGMVEAEPANRNAVGNPAEPSMEGEGIVSLEKEYAQMLNTLENVFDAAEAPDIPGEVPEHLCCKITMEVFRDPVITPSGITYERSVLLDHLARGRNFDPLTRTPLEEYQIAPNLAMKNAVHAFLEEHGWAHQAVYNPSL